VGEAMELVVDEWNQSIESAPVAAAPSQQQGGWRRRIGRNGALSYRAACPADSLIVRRAGGDAGSPPKMRVANSGTGVPALGAEPSASVRIGTAINRPSSAM
jgi:hypothetical protein